MDWHCEATGVMGLETPSQTRSEELPEIYKEHSELGRVLRTGPVFHRKKASARGSQPRPWRHRLSSDLRSRGCPSISRYSHHDDNWPTQIVVRLSQRPGTNNFHSGSLGVAPASIGTESMDRPPARPT
jgi:hypothetical protein